MPFGYQSLRKVGNHRSNANKDEDAEDGTDHFCLLRVVKNDKGEIRQCKECGKHKSPVPVTIGKEDDREIIQVHEDDRNSVRKTIKGKKSYQYST